MEGKSSSSSSSSKVPLHTSKLSSRTGLNRVFAVAYTCGILALLYHHAVTLLFHCTTLLSLAIHLSMIISDLILGFMWSTTAAFRMRPLHRQEFPENLPQVIRTDKDFPALDIFICTADPYKEPPMNVANTALSVMAYDYPPEKLSIYLSDDGGSDLTLLAFIEAAKFGTHWLPFCREKNIVERCPEAYFTSNYSACTQAQNIKRLYESMKVKVESAVERGKVGDEYISCEQQRQAFEKWTKEFTPQHHPTVIQVLLETGKNKDITGHPMPNLTYVSRQKSPASPHHFKAGALNALLRVSAVLTNAPIVLTLDCDMYSNDPQTPHRMLCYFMDPAMKPKLGYVQFPQHFNGLSKNDIYACENKRLFQINPLGLDGLGGPNCVGTNCFFSRRAFFGGPSSFVTPEMPELCPDHIVDKPVQALAAQAHHVASCNYEDHTNWGYEIGFRYGSLVEDYYTGYRLHCEGWRSVYCNPEREAFLGDAPFSLGDMLSQNKRWCVGLLEVALSKYSPVTFGAWAVGPLMALCYAQYAFWPIWSFPITLYAFLPQLALLNGLAVFPKVSDQWFWLYAFLFLGAYGQDCLDFVLTKGRLRRWWSDQRIWMTRGLSSHLFGLVEFVAKGMGIATHGFNVTSKVVDDEQSKRYEQGMFEFGVASPMFVPMAVAAIINLVAFLSGLRQVLMGRNIDGLFVQMFIAGFAVLNCWPIYEAMVLRTDKGRMPTKTTILSTFLAWALYALVSFTPTP